MDLSALEKLKQTSQELKQKEQAKLEAEREKKKAEQRTREKNKTFADLLEESNMDWKKFK
nr:YqkE family protein [Aneurinibacillus tyrosinisolvens]